MATEQIYVLVIHDTDAAQAYRSLEAAQQAASNRCGKRKIEWDYHTGHGAIWLARYERMNIQLVTLNDDPPARCDGVSGTIGGQAVFCPNTPVWLAKGRTAPYRQARLCDECKPHWEDVVGDIMDFHRIEQESARAAGPTSNTAPGASTA